MSFHGKYPEQSMYGKNHFDIAKVIYNKLWANIMLNGEKLKLSKYGTIQDSLLPLVFTT